MQKKRDTKEKICEKENDGFFSHESRHEAEARIMGPAYIMPV